MLSDSCLDFCVGVRNLIQALRKDADHYNREPWDYELGEIAALKRACDHALDNEDCDEPRDVDRLLEVTRLIVNYHFTPPKDDEYVKDPTKLPCEWQVTELGEARGRALREALERAASGSTGSGEAA
jgi:hypothetical protein